MRHAFVALAALTGIAAWPVCAVGAQAPAAPTLVVLISVDQMRADYLDRFAPQLTGGLARRRLLSTPELPSWPHTDVLTNSVVHLSVDAEGVPISAVIVSGSGLKEADNYALAASKRLRFKPERARETVTSGTAIR